MKALKWTLASLVLLGFADPSRGQPMAAPGLQPLPAPPAGVNPMGNVPLGNMPMGNGAALAPNYVPDGSYPAGPGQSYGGESYGGPISGAYANAPGSACYDAGCPPVFDNVYSSPGTFFFRAEAFMLRRSNTSPNIRLVATSPTNVVLFSSDLRFKNEVGQRFESGYEFNECASIGFTFWEVQDWNPIVSTFSNTSNLTLAGGAGQNSANFTNAMSMEAQYRTMIKNYEINWTNATIFDRLSLLAGMRYVDMIDRLAIISTRTIGDATQIGTSDYIMRVTNRLLGGQIGAKVQYDIDLWSLEFTGKSGLYDDGIQFSKFYGDRNNTVVVNPQAAPPVAHSLAAINELNLSFSRKLGNHMAVRGGYNAIWITNIGLASDHFDPSINHLNNNVVREGGDLFLHGVNAGVDLRY